MTRFAVLVVGEDHPIDFDGNVVRTAFYVWRCVEAADEAEARSVALDMVQEDPYLTRVMRSASGYTPVLKVEEVRRDWGELSPPGSGFIFYAQDGEDPEARSGCMSWLFWWRGPPCPRREGALHYTSTPLPPARQAKETACPEAKTAA